MRECLALNLRWCEWVRINEINGAYRSTVRPKKRKALKWRSIEGVTLQIPLLLIVLIFLAWPIVWTFALSFTNMSLTGATALHWNWVGFANFAQLFHNGGFFKSIGLSVVYLVGSAYLGQCVFGFILALLIQNRPKWIATIVGGIIVLAWVVPEIIGAFMWYALLSNGGVLSQMMAWVHIPYHTWLISHPMLSIILANSWRGVAFSMMIFTAALSNIPPELMEAASVDGASTWWKITKITVPLLKSTVMVDLVLITLATLNDFTLIYAMTGGGPGDNSNVLSVFMYQEGFTNYQMAYGAAISVVLQLIGVVLSVSYIRALRSDK